MFKYSLLRPILFNWSSSCRRLVSSQNAVIGYGSSEMPDKLYKTIEIEMKSAEPAVLRSYETFLLSAAKHLEINIGKRWCTSPTHKRWTLLKSVFVYRKHMVQYEVRTYYRWIQFHKITGSTADTFLEYIERMLPEGVALKITKLSLEPLPVHIRRDNIRRSLLDAGLQTSEINENSSEENVPNTCEDTGRN